MLMSRSELLYMWGSFTWLWNHEFHISCREGDLNSIYSDAGWPSGDNTLRPAPEYDELCRALSVETGVEFFGLDKGSHRLGDRLPIDVVIVGVPLRTSIG